MPNFIATDDSARPSSDEDRAGAVLEGIRVLEFSQVIAAPAAGQILAELGAEVIKVEPPGGESWRLLTSFAPAESKSYQSLNRGKKDITLNLGSEEATTIVHRLVPSVDVVLINYRPDVPARFRIDYDTLKTLKPDLVYVDLTAFGRHGPWALRPGYDGVVQAVTGLMAGEGKVRPDGAPMTIVSTAIADYTTGIVLADAVVTALYDREVSGQGQLVDCSLFATALALQGDVVMEHALADQTRNEVRDARRKQARDGASFEAMVRTREQQPDPFVRAYLVEDGALVVEALDETARVSLLEVLGCSSADGMAAIFATRTLDHWVERLHARGVPCSPVHFPEELAHLEQTRANSMFAEYQHPVTGWQCLNGPVLEFSAAATVEDRPSPRLGADTEAVLAGLGFTSAEIDALADRGVVGER
jgi:formyl-CoA transferase